MTKKKQSEKRKLTLDDFASPIQQDLIAMGKDIANEGSGIRGNMATREEIREVRDDVKRITDLMVSKADLARTLREEFDASAHVQHVEEPASARDGRGRKTGD